MWLVLFLHFVHISRNSVTFVLGNIGYLPYKVLVHLYSCRKPYLGCVRSILDVCP